ncbi:MAG: DNA-deoxyinosine glycosylase [Oscillospiraceae bacterium]|nr:DNA-deoxyinosine glycosylase [Oscillospiraceae bacterium]
MQPQKLDHSDFGPFFDADSELLILGSFPSVKSREAKFFYGHPQNRFWRVIAAVFDVPAPQTLEEKKAFLSAHHIALYDVIEACTIVGSSDSSIRDVRAADIRPILAGSRVSRVFCNGGTAYALYEKHIYPVSGAAAVKLPSTSPANAAWSLDRLTSAWREAIL